MSPAQLDRLKKDSRELVHYERFLEKKGNSALLHKIKRKREYLESKILDLKMEYS